MSGTLQRTLQKPYNLFLRNHLPRKWAVYRGIPARDVRLLDLTTTFPQYKQGLVEAIQEHVSGERVDLVGFGRGVSTVLMLRAGAAHITAYEASEEMVRIGQETLKQQVDLDGSRVDIRHAIVGDAIQVYGEPDGQELAPDEIVKNDATTLVMDAEGASLSILPAVVGAYETIIVECHPSHGASAEQLRPMLEGYDVQARQYEPDREKRVLVGVA